MTDSATLSAGDVQALVTQCLQGDQAGYAALYDSYAPGLYRLCYSLLLHREDAEDVAQDSFVYAFRNLYRFDARLSSFRTWLYTIAICRCRNNYRKHRVPMLDLDILLNIGLPAPLRETPEAALARSDAREAIGRALAALNPRLREAIVLRYGQGMAYREIAEVMDCPQKTAESRVRLAHDTLRGMLGRHGQSLLDDLLTWNQE